MYGGGAYRIVDLHAIEEHDSEHNEDAGDCSNDDRRFNRDIGAAASDADESGQTAIDCHAQIGFAHCDPGGDGGGQNRHNRGGIGRHEDMHHVLWMFEAHGGSRIESEPPQPEDEQSDNS